MSRRSRGWYCSSLWLIILLASLALASCETQRQHTPNVLAASFTYDPLLPMVGQSVQFTDTSTGSPASWSWDFGDGASSAAANPTHAYSASGPYTVILRIAAASDSSEKSQIVNVQSPGTIIAASPSYADVDAAISAASPGDIVRIPAGQAVWSHNLVIAKSLRLIGAGIGQTIITSNYWAPNPDYNIVPEQSLISFAPDNPAENPPFRLSGMTINCTYKCQGILLRNETEALCDKIRIDHIHIYNADWALTRFGTVYGVMDNCIVVGGLDHAGLHSYWTSTPYNFGGSDNFYFEDNEWGGVVDEFNSAGNESPRYCIRYNRIIGDRITGDGIRPLCDLHGNQGSSGHSASQGAEIYENTITMGSKVICLLDQRGGKVLCFNNYITSSDTAVTKVREEENDNLMPPANNLISGQPQHVSESYYWGNRLNGSIIINPYIDEIVNYGGSIGLVPQEDREFWCEKAQFNGTSGIGVGLLAGRPSTGTKGVAYWATDTKTLYICRDTNSWVEYYRPYAYPHPLRNIL